MSKIKRFLGVVVAFGLLFSSFQVTHAYVKEGHKLPNKVISYKWGSNLDSGSSVIKTGWQNAASAWYNSAANANFFYNSNSVNVLNSWYESSSTYYGKYTASLNSNNIVTKFTGYINSGNSNITKTHVAKSTGVHEMGHVLGIAHNSGTSIMNSSRNRETMHVPQADDTNGVNAIY